MSRTDEVTENPNDKQSPGKPLDPNEVAPTDNNGTDDAGSAAMDQEAREERDEAVVREEFEGLDNDLVNVGKFVEQSADNDVPASSDEGEDRPRQPGETPGRQTTEEAGSRS